MRQRSTALAVLPVPAGGRSGAAARDQAGGHAGRAGDRPGGVHAPGDPRRAACRVARSSPPPGIQPPVPPLGWPPRSSAPRISALAKFQLDVESVGRGHGDPGRRLGRAADRAHRRQGLGVGARAAGRTRRRPARRCGVLALSSGGRAGHAGGPDADGDFPSDRQAGRRSRRAAESGAAGGASDVTLSGDIAGTLVTDARGRLRAAGVPGQGHGRDASRVATLLKSLPDSAERASSQPETWAARRPYWARPRSTSLKGFVHESLVRLPRAARAVPRVGGTGSTTAGDPLPASDTTAALRPAPAVTLSLQEALDAGPGQQPDLSADAQRRGPRQVGRAQRLRQPVAAR